LKFGFPPSLSVACRNPVGFDGSYGVKLFGLWAVESRLPPIHNDGKGLK